MDESTEKSVVQQIANLCASLLDIASGGRPYILLMADPEGATEPDKLDTVIMSPLPREAVEAILAEVGQRLPGEGRSVAQDTPRTAAWPFPKNKH